MLLYHVTLESNVASISISGINPAFAQGKKLGCWYVTRRRLNWAIAHVSQRKKAWPDKLVVYSVYVQPTRMIRTSVKGVYRINGVVRTTRPYLSALRYIGEAIDV